MKKLHKKCLFQLLADTFHISIFNFSIFILIAILSTSNIIDGRVIIYQMSYYLTGKSNI